MDWGKLETCALCEKQFKPLLESHNEMGCIAALREENARLARERDDATEMHEICHKERDEARAEVARLEGLISAVDMAAGHSVYAEHWQAFQAEARRIRAAKGK